MTPDRSTQEEPTSAPPGDRETATASAEAAIARLEDLQRVTDAALAYLNLEDLMAVLLERVVEILQVDTSAVLLVEDEGRTLAARAAKGLEEEVETGFRLPVGRGFAGRVAATRQPVVIEDLENTPIEVVNPLLREKGIRSLLGVPLIVEGSLIGVLHVGSLTPREFRAADVELVQLVGDRVALEIERNRLQVQGRIAQTLQRNLLPRSLPQLPGLRMAARYLPAAQESAVGGDWYDVIELGHRRIGLAIGDVAGHGVAAATLMGELRSAARAYALEEFSPAELLGKLARFADQEEARMATMIYGTLNLDTWVVDFARAGHPYPLVLRADGGTEFLTDASGPPLGTGGTPEYTQQRVTMNTGDTLMLYTDGLIERRGQQLTEGESALAEAAVRAPAEAEARCRTVIQRMTEGREVADDIAVLVVHSVGLEERITARVPARAEELAGIRYLLRRWLAVNGATDDDCASFAIAATEASANAIGHAYGPAEAEIEVTAALDSGVAIVTIRDHGRWKKPRGENRGRGIPVMREFMDEVLIDAGEDGTVVELRRRIGSGRR
jgi:serine phosphatase RsbU (regulator of sigma subunit)/anti-sigma regulatory factor (Ser/Thr protein kinase)